MRSRPAALAACAALALSAALAGCSPATSARGPAATPAARPATSQPPAPPASPALPATDWTTYHRDAARTGVAPASPAAGPLAIAWRRRLDGAVYGQPLVIGGLVVAATEGDTVYGLDRATGQVRWQVHLGTPVPLSALPCGDIDPLGITGTPVYDPATGLVYAVAETTGFHHVLAGIAVPSGRLAFRRDVPTPDGHPRDDQQRAALALDQGRIYVAFGGLAGDCGPYQGSVNGIPASGRGPMVSYKVPTAREGGMWMPGGPVVGPSGTIYVSAGNGAATAPPWDGSDSVTALTPGLRRTGIFAPVTWPADNASDLDLGSSPPALLSDGMLLIAGKRGTAYLLNASHLAGVGSQVAQAPVCPAYGGAAVAGQIVYLPCEGGGMAAVDTAGSRIRILWRGPPGAAGSPVLGGGAVWVPDWAAGVLYELSPGTGHVRHKIRLGSALPHFASPSLSGPLALIGTMRGVVAVRGA
jgi:outer membrane protein assembly factor BamB